MIRSLLFVIALVSILTSCTKDGVGKITNGTYDGKFRAITPTSNNELAGVSLTIKGNRYEGASTMQMAPGICSGKLTTQGRHLTVTNECFYQANIDMKYIFSGEYEYEVNGKELKIYRTYNDTVSFVYQLTKVE